MRVVRLRVPPCETMFTLVSTDEQKYVCHADRNHDRMRRVAVWL